MTVDVYKTLKESFINNYYNYIYSLKKAKYIEYDHLLDQILFIENLRYLDNIEAIYEKLL